MDINELMKHFQASGFNVEHVSDGIVVMSGVHQNCGFPPEKCRCIAGKQVTISELPGCDFCPEQARFDFRTFLGPWAYGCPTCYEQHRVYKDLGPGRGQRLALPGEDNAPQG